MNKPKAKDFHTNDGMHSAMRAWANAQCKPEMWVEVLYSDSADVFTFNLERATKEVEYKTLDGEVYTVSVETAKFINDFMPGEYELSLKEFKEAFKVWAIPSQEHIHIVSIKWVKAK